MTRSFSDFDQALEFCGVTVDNVVEILDNFDVEHQSRIEDAVDQLGDRMRQTLRERRNKKRGINLCDDFSLFEFSGEDCRLIDSTNIGSELWQLVELSESTRTAIIEDSLPFSSQSSSINLPTPRSSPETLCSDAVCRQSLGIPSPVLLTRSSEDNHQQQSTVCAVSTVMTPLQHQTLPRTTNLSMSDNLQKQKQLLFRLMGRGPDSVAGKTSFDEFREAVKYIQCQQLLKLPSCDESALTLLNFLNKVKSAEFAHALYHRVGSWRFKQIYLRRISEHAERRSKMSDKQKRLVKEGKPSSLARFDMIMNIDSSSSRSSSSPETRDEKLRTKCDNSLSAARIWHEICEIAGPGITPLIPRVPTTRLEKLPEASRCLLYQYLKEQRNGYIWDLARFLSPHVEAMLEGKECALGQFMDLASLSDWDGVYNCRDKFPQCPHSLSQSS